MGSNSNLENAYNFIKNDDYIDFNYKILKYLQENYVKLLGNFDITTKNIIDDILKYDVNIFTFKHNLSSRYLFRDEVIYTKLLTYCFNIKNIGNYLYNEILKLIDKNREICNINAFSEYYINENGKRIDIFITDNNKKGECIIEAKINAEEHGEQKKYYKKFAKKNNINNLIYLTINTQGNMEQEWCNITWLQLAAALLSGLIKSKKIDTPQGIYVKFFISNILYHLYEINFNINDNENTYNNLYIMSYVTEFIQYFNGVYYGK